MAKGHISPVIAAILRNPEAKRKLREAMDSGKDFVIRIGDTTYRISTRDAGDIPAPTNSTPTNRAARAQ